jgi:hypothetical protein
MSTQHIRFTVASLLLVFLFRLSRATGVAGDEAVPVRFNEGLVHGFLKVSSADGTRLADGDLFQTSSGGRVTGRLTFHFKDGSLQDETTVFTQQKAFRLISYHLIQKGPSFPRALDMSIDAQRQVTVRYAGDHGEPKTEIEHLPADVAPANGMILTMLKNVRPHQPPASLSLVVATPKPQVVSLLMSSAGDESFSTQSRALRRESEGRRCPRRGGEGRGETSAGLPRLGAPWRCPGIHQIRTAVLHRRSALADRTDEPGVA